MIGRSESCAADDSRSASSIFAPVTSLAAARDLSAYVGRLELASSSLF
jgi:hypothetical protein